MLTHGNPLSPIPYTLHGHELPEAVKACVERWLAKPQVPWNSFEHPAECVALAIAKAHVSQDFQRPIDT